jgi:hypothetical protein
MSSIVIKGDTSGQVTLDVPAIAGTTILNLPASSGTVVVGSVAASAVGQIPFSTDGATYTPTAKIVSGTAVASTSGTSVDFTGIPSWAKRITVMFAGVSTSGTSIMQIQIGDAGGFETSGYLGGATRVDGVIASAAYSAGYLMSNQAIVAASTYSGQWVILKIDGNTWVENHTITETGDASSIGSGYKALSDTLTQLRITTVGGTDTFDAGSINILYE